MSASNRTLPRPSRRQSRRRQRRWQRQCALLQLSSPQPAPASGTGPAESAPKIGTWLRTLYVQPYLLLTAAMRKDQAACTKTTPAKRCAALPRDEDLEPKDSGFNLFPDWPWERPPRLAPDLQYKRVGRPLRSIHWCKQYCTHLFTNMRHAFLPAASDALLDQFTDAGCDGVHDRTLLSALQALQAD